MDNLRGKPSALSYLVFLIFFSTIVLFIAELSIRVLMNIPADFISKITYHNSDMSPPKRVRPNLNGTYVGAYREYRFHVSTNADGFRRSAPFALNDTQEPQIIFLGDSQTFGIGMDDEQTIASYTSSQLNLPVLNAGCSGYNNIEELLLAKDLLKKHHPKYFVLLFYPGNDLYENYTNRTLLSGGETAPSGHPNKSHLKDRVKSYMVRNSALYILFKGMRNIPIINHFLYRLGIVERSKPNELVVYERHPSEKYQAYWQLTDQVLLQIDKTIRDFGSELLIVFVPDKVQIDTTYWKLWQNKFMIPDDDVDLMNPNAHLNDFASSHQLHFVDPTKEFVSHYQSGEKLYWHLDHHLRSEGNKLIADSIANFISAANAHKVTAH